jgi:hypothetical protein
MARSLKERIKGFLETYRNTGHIVLSAEKNGISRNRHYHWLKTKPGYRELFEQVRREAGEFLESEAVTRSTTGYKEPVFYQGKRCGWVTRYDSSLLQFLIRGHLPDRYASRTEVSGPQGQPIEAKITVVYVDPSTAPQQHAGS